MIPFDRQKKGDQKVAVFISDVVIIALYPLIDAH